MLCLTANLLIFLNCCSVFPLTAIPTGAGKTTIIKVSSLLSQVWSGHQDVGGAVLQCNIVALPYLNPSSDIVLSNVCHDLVLPWRSAVASHNNVISL